MTKPYELFKEPIQVSQGYNLLAYKRDGLILNSGGLAEYVRLTASGLSANQTAVFDLDSYGLDLMPDFMLANFVSNTGNVTFSIRYYNNPVMTFSVNGNSARDGVALPKIPISHPNSQLWITSAQAANFIWVSAQQISLLDNLNQDYFV